MKKNFLKVLAIAVCAILLVVGSIAGTVAYLMDSAEVTNTFTVGNVSITMDEAKADEYGNFVNGEGQIVSTAADAARVAGTAQDKNVYKIIPGHSYKKNPTIVVEAGSEDCYLFFKINVSNNDFDEKLTFDIGSDWTQIDSTGVYFYNTKAVAGTVVDPFTTFTVDSDIEDVSVYAAAEITVTAYAVQADGFADATTAWTNTFGK